MLSEKFKASLCDDPRIKAVEIQYNAAKVPFKPAFDAIAENVTGGIDNYQTSSLVQQLVQALLYFLNEEVAKCKPKTGWAKVVKFLWPILKMFAREKIKPK